MVYPDREYAVLRLTTDDGVHGSALGYTRGAPLGEELRLLAPFFLGRDSGQIQPLRTEAESALAPARGNFLRALNLIDIALWDIAAKRAGVPLYRLLGGGPRQIPVIAVAGYFRDVRGNESVLEEISSLAQQGFPIVKIMLHGVEPDVDASFASSAAAHIPHGALAIDFHSAWTNVGDAWRTCRLIDDLGLQFIEDPFRVNHADHYRALSTKIRTPLTTGEDALYLETFKDVLPALGYLRLDATVSTGISDAQAVIAMARMAGRQVVTHVFAPIHAQLAGAFSEVSAVEWISPAIAADPWDRLLQEVPRIERGHLILGEQPGIGIEFDWDAVRAHGTCLEIRA